MSASGSPFWAYSLRFYRDPETQAACLDAQDRLGADVNMILYVLFRASLGTALDRDAVGRADAAVASWRDGVVQPLRRLRRDMKPLPHAIAEEDQSAIRGEVKKLELRAEQAQQHHLETLDLDGAPAEPVDAARANAAAYAGLIGADPDDPALAALLTRFAALQADPA